MNTVTFYHQEREDGGRRTGLSVNGLRALERFVPGPEADHPNAGLQWYVDVSYDLDEVPPTQEAAVGWFHEHAREIESALGSAVERLEGGMDIDAVPWLFTEQMAGGTLHVAVSAMRRYVARDIAQRLGNFLATDWQAFQRESPIVGEGVRAWRTEFSTPTS